VFLEAAGADAAVPITADTLDSDLIGVTRQTAAVPDEVLSLGTSQRVDVLLKRATSAAVELTAVLGGITLVNAKGSQAAIILGPNPLISPIEQDFLLEDGEETEMEPALYIADQGGIGVEIPGGINFRGTITVTAFNTFTFTASTRLTAATLAAADTAAKLRQRIRLVQIPDASIVLRVLGKRAAPTFTNDLDQPGLTGVENTLIALVQGDMLQRERHYAKAQSLYSEAAQLLEQLKQEETVQMAHEQRVIPETGYGVEEDNRLYGFSF
jgi:hypothetical protein